MPKQFLFKQIQQATQVLRNGGVIAYPTEYCFGLGCDPRNATALEKLLKIKRRKPEQGVILIAANVAQIGLYADLPQLSDIDNVTDSWPGPNTWLLPALAHVSHLVRGAHTTIAMRIPEHEFCLKLLTEFDHPIVSTSANRSGEREHLTSASVVADLGVECDFVVDAPVGGATQASTIRDAKTGHILR